jgi:ferritin
MLDAKLQKALNGQINAELSSAYQYLAMAAQFEAINLPGSAQWMRRQAREEVTHAMKIFDYVVARDGRVTLEAVGQPKGKFASPLEMWETAYAQEQRVTRRIDALYAQADAGKDYATVTMLQWFVTEQVEEEKTVRGIVDQVRSIGPSNSAILFIDRHLGKDAAGG